MFAKKIQSKVRQAGAKSYKKGGVCYLHTPPRRWYRVFPTCTTSSISYIQEVVKMKLSKKAWYKFPVILDHIPGITSTASKVGAVIIYYCRELCASALKPRTEQRIPQYRSRRARRPLTQAEIDNLNDFMQISQPCGQR